MTVPSHSAPASARAIVGDVVIIGAGQAGFQVAVSLRQRKFAGSIVLVGDEPHPPYQRPPLSKGALKGSVEPESLWFRPEGFLEAQKIAERRGVEARSIDRTGKSVTLSDGSTLAYGTLVIATGAAPRKLPQALGPAAPSAAVLRTLDDALALRERLADHREVIVVGAGYIGLEAAASARALGAAVTVIDREERLMQRTASPAMSAYFKGLHERKGVDFVLGGALEQLTLDGQRWTARLEGGATLEGDLVIAGIGVVPRTALAEEAGLTVEDGIVTDEHGRTSDPSIFAAGDCVRHAHTKHAQLVRFESVQSAIDQAKVVAANILGEAAQHSATPWFWSDQYDAKLQVVGTLEPDLDVLRRGEPASGSFAIYHLRGPVPVAVEAVNAPQDFVRARKAIAGGLPLDEAFLSDLTSV